MLKDIQMYIQNCYNNFMHILIHHLRSVFCGCFCCVLWGLVRKKGHCLKNCAHESKFPPVTSDVTQMLDNVFFILSFCCFWAHAALGPSHIKCISKIEDIGSHIRN